MQSHSTSRSLDASSVFRSTIASVQLSAFELLCRYCRAVDDEPIIGIGNTCTKHGLTRGQFRRLRKAHASGGAEALNEAAMRIIRRIPRVRTTVDALIRSEALAHPTFGRFRIAQALNEQGIDVTPRQVARVLQRMKAAENDVSEAASA